MIERRKSFRVECEIELIYRDLDSGKPAKIEAAIIKNISRGGVKIRTDEFLPIKDHLYVTIHLPNHHTIEAQLVPAWVVELPHLGKFEMGARFTSIKPGDEEAIQSFQYQALLEKMPAHISIAKDLTKKEPPEKNQAS